MEATAAAAAATANGNIDTGGGNGGGKIMLEISKLTCAKSVQPGSSGSIAGLVRMETDELNAANSAAADRHRAVSASVSRRVRRDSVVSAFSDAVADKEEEFHRDPLTETIGVAGPFQIMWHLILGITVMFHSWQMFANKWLTYKTDHWCARPPSMSHLSPEQWMNISSPLLDDGGFDRCHIFNVDFGSMEDPVRPAEDTAKIDCGRWEYDESLLQDTAIKRFDLVCDQQHIPRIVQFTFFAGNFFGVLASGLIADKFGRKTCYMIFLTLWIVFGLTGSFATTIYGWLISRFMSGALSLGYNTIIAVFTIELTHGKWRPILGHCICEIWWPIGHMVMGGLVAGCTNMITLEMVIALCNVPFLVLWYFMPESPRWLLAKGRKEKAREVLRTACKLNKKSLKELDAFIDAYEVPKSEERKASIIDLFRFRYVRRNQLILCGCWLSFSMGYFGLSYNTPAFALNPFLVFSIPGMIAFCFSFAQPFMENYFGRKMILMVSLITTGVLLLITLAFPSGSVGITICAVIGNVIAGAAFGVGYTFTKEVMPTVVRTTALSTASASARIGSMLSPVIGMLDVYMDVLPLVVYGIILLITGISSIWIWPETKSIKLPDTLEEANEIAGSDNPWLKCGCCSCCRKKQDK